MCCMVAEYSFFFFKQKTAYEMRISDWGSDVCSSDLTVWKLPDMWAFSGSEHYLLPGDPPRYRDGYLRDNRPGHEKGADLNRWLWLYKRHKWRDAQFSIVGPSRWIASCAHASELFSHRRIRSITNPLDLELYRSEEHTSELQSLLRISYAVLCLQ